MSSYKELVDVDVLLRFKPNQKSIAIALDSDSLEDEPIFLPTSKIEVHDTGRKEAGLPIITVTMPQWLAENEGLV